VDAVDVIRTKRDGKRLSDAQIAWFIDSYTNGHIAHEQASALLMAIVWRGMEPDELAVWTRAMIDSGDQLVLDGIEQPTADKHSTGGVGDKISLPLAPLAAACGLAVPMISGRGLGHTGGTLDKLEAIPGFDVDLSSERFLEVLRQVGCVISSAGEDLAPADRKLYALRDVTGTVESVPLISSSIMSKKIAEGTEALVLDVKVGSGAFLPTIERARELAETMVRLGDEHGVKMSAVLTNMDEPLGLTAGNGLEVTESLATLSGQGPDDIRAITLALADEMLDLVGVKADTAAALDDGSALSRWREMVEAQRGDSGAPMAEASERSTLSSPEAGYITRVDARAVGIAAWRLGAGRARKEDPVSAVAGTVLLKRSGEKVEKGEPLIELHAEDPARFTAALESLEGAFSFGPEPPPERKLILETIRP
jgi:thymidine phosphorylase